MRFDGIEAAGLTVAILAVIVSCVFIAQNSFPAFQYASYSNPHMANVTQSVGKEVSKFMWESRSLDLIAQALVLFGAAIGCLAILRSEKDEKKVKSE